MAKKKNLIGQKFGRLTVISEAAKHYRKDTRAIWNCICECGDSIIVPTNRLTNDNTRSCGCLKSEKAKNNIQQALKISTKYEPHISTARRLWLGYHNDGPELCDLTFDQWFDMSQQNCFYCGAAPFNTYNRFLKKKDASSETKNKGYFTYNGMDRIDSKKHHTSDNVVPCCPICNRAKSDRAIQDFYQYITTLQISDTFIPPTDLLILPTGYLIVSVKGAYRHYPRNYGTMEIDLATFYTFSQLPCYYCGTEKSNYFNVYLKDKKASQAAKDGAHFYYNGIDRVDNNKTHIIDNIVPCCYYCNFAKGKLALPEFQAWIKRVQTFQSTK